MITREEAYELLKKYNKEDFHLHHGRMVGGAMRYFAKKLGYGDQEEFWAIVGLLHDIDFEMWPDDHCKKAKELLAEAGYPDGFTLECMVLKNNLQVATMAQEMFRKVGVEMNVTSVEPATYLPESRTGNYDITIGTNANGYIKPDNFNLLSYDNRFEVIGGPKVNDPAIEDIIAKAQSPDEATAEEGWHDVIDYIFDNSILVGLYSKIECAAMNPALEGLRTLKRDYLDYTMIHPIQ